MSRALTDVLLAVLATAVAVGWAVLAPQPKPLDAWGVLLAVAACAPLAVRRRRPVVVLVVHMAVSVPYHALDYPHDALVVPGLLVVYTVASVMRRPHSLLVGTGAVVVVLVIRAVDDGRVRFDTLTTLGWMVAAVGVGEAVRSRRAYLAEIVDRAERAERTREEEALRRVTEERLRIARDLHDLLAHSITLIHVQAGVAAHLLAESADRLNRTVMVRSLDTITEACLRARAELRATLAVLRDSTMTEHPDEDRRPVPALSRLSDLTAPVTAVGVTVDLVSTGDSRPLPPAVEVAAYRIVQEALTNVVKHAVATRARVELAYLPDALVVTVTDDGRGGAGTAGGYGFVGMVERARSVGGTLTAGSARDGGFRVMAELPTGEHG
ncbi:sensor histidine kinase [Kibdelosporangium persicum]|uniref:histidine kinase n=1 Tax=Kibdelosporangium persicum TaxID=2698649 RepID=A0ABX2FAX8_9PSEU|nr:histidine kinase [Kibdelosporangium persicum]NRN68042.1 Two-component sensor histidine kinase [Kibdelosporangium persicum]